MVALAEMRRSADGAAAAGCPLSAEQLAAYLRDGYVVLQAELDAEFHTAMWQAACAVHDRAKASGERTPHLQTIGDNLRAQIPALHQLLNAPTVRGALASVLGEDHLLHPHHFVHESTPADQSFHQDGNLPWNERGHYRSHRPNWAMLFYYPQPVTAAAGPTEVLPGTQYWTTNFERPNGGWHPGDALDKTLQPEELKNPDLAARDQRIDQVPATLGIAGLSRQRLLLPAGSVVLAHYDLMHRGCRAAPGFDGRRFMYKFYYLRTADPRPATVPPSPWPESAEPGPIDGVAQDVAHWLHGDAAWHRDVPSAGQADRLQVAAAEDERIRLAYEIGHLARESATVREQLGAMLRSENEPVRRAMIYAAGICGDACEPAVAAALAAADPRVRRAGAAAAGEARLTNEAVIERLFVLLETDADALVRSNAAYALGLIARWADAAVPATRLLARLDPAREPNNTTRGRLNRSTVRINIVYALANKQLTSAELGEFAQRGLADPDRYVRGLAIAVLERVAQSRAEPWLAELVGHLAAARFNPPPA